MKQVTEATKREGVIVEREAVIVSAVRTPMGNFRGNLQNLPVQALGAFTVKEALRRCNLAPEEIQEVIIGHGFSWAEGVTNVARTMGILAGLPSDIPALTVNRFCASGLEAVNIAAGLINSGEAEVVLAGGTDSVSTSPFFRHWELPFPPGYGDLTDTLEGGLFSGEKVLGLGLSAEAVVKKYKITRESQDQFAAESQIKAVQAMDGGRFLSQMVPVKVSSSCLVQDEGLKRGITVDNLANLPGSYLRDGTVTPGNSARLADGAAILLLMDRQKARASGIKPLGTVISYARAAVGVDRQEYAGALAIQKALAAKGLRLQDMDLVEIDEPFAGQCLVMGKLLKWDWEKVNVNGGSLALGMPVGACGAVSLVNLIHEMETRKARFGLAGVSSGAQGAATVIRCK